LAYHGLVGPILKQCIHRAAASKHRIVRGGAGSGVVSIQPMRAGSHARACFCHRPEVVLAKNRSISFLPITFCRNATELRNSPRFSRRKTEMEDTARVSAVSRIV